MLAKDLYSKSKDRLSAAWFCDVSRLFFEHQYLRESMIALEDGLKASDITSEMRLLFLENIIMISGSLADDVDKLTFYLSECTTLYHYGIIPCSERSRM